MAITGKFAADFESFYDAVTKADAKLADFQSGAGRVETALNKMVDSFSGRKVIQDATLMAEAVERIGGVSKLTDAELAKVSASAQAAADKLRAMGVDVPPGIQRIADAMKSGHEATGFWLGALHELGSSFVLRVAEGVLLRDAIHEVISKVKELIGVLPEIALKGAAVADVEENFKRLTVQAGLLGDELMGALRAGTHETITDFELMKTANKDLAAGMNLTQGQFKTLADGAFALAQATGGDVKTALDTMNDAMLTGRTRALALLTGKIDVTKAEEAFAASLGKTKDNLTEAGKLEAMRAAILKAVGEATARLGEQVDGLDERVAQANVSWQNFQENLGKTIAVSKVLETGMVGIKQALIDTFGGSQESLIKAISSAIDQGAIALVGFAETGVKTAGFLIKEWYAVEKVFGNIGQVLSGDALAFEYLALAVAKAGAAVAIGEASNKKWADEVTRVDANITALLVSMKKRGDALQEDDRQQAGVDARTQSYVATLEGLRLKMAAAAKGAVDFVGPLQQTADAHDKAGKAAGNQTDGLLKLSAAEEAAAKKFADAWGELDSVGQNFADTVATINPLILEQINYYLRAGVAVSTVAAAYPQLSTAQVNAAEKFDKANTKSVNDASKLWNELYALQTSHGGTAMDAQIAAIDKWFDDEVLKIDFSSKNWRNHWDAIAAVASEKLNGISVDWALLGANSKEHLQDIANNAASTYSAALSSSLTFTDGFIKGLQKTAIEAQTAADLFGTSFEKSADKANAAVTSTTKKITDLTIQVKASADELAHWYDNLNGPNTGQRTGASPVSGIISNVGNLANLSRRADGGPVNAGQSYVVGERGPEIFTPRTSGGISPNGGGGGGNVTVNLTMSGVMATDKAALQAAVSAAVMDALRTTRRLGSA